MVAVEKDNPVDHDQAVPFAYIRARDKSHRQGWAVIAAPLAQHEPLREAIRGVQGRGDKVNLPSLIEAFKGKVTASGQGEVPQDIREALDLLYSEGDPDQPALDFGQT